MHSPERGNIDLSRNFVVEDVKDSHADCYRVRFEVANEHRRNSKIFYHPAVLLKLRYENRNPQENGNQQDEPMTLMVVNRNRIIREDNDDQRLDHLPTTAVLAQEFSILRPRQ